MSLVSVDDSRPIRPRPAAEDGERWSPILATLFWSAVSGLIWSVILGTGAALL